MKHNLQAVTLNKVVMEKTPNCHTWRKIILMSRVKKDGAYAFKRITGLLQNLNTNDSAMNK